MTILDLQILGAAALIFLPLERMLPLHREHRTLRPGMGVDLLHIFVSGFLIRSGAFATTVFLSIIAWSIVPEGFRSLVQSQSFLLQFAGMLILSDLCFYLAHRLVHSLPWLWRFHSVHHSSEQLDWIATYRVHPLDQILNSTIIALPGLALGFSPGPLLAYAMLYRWHAMLLHSNVKVELGALGKVIATPRFHHWHHADEPQAYDKNFAGQLAIWDRLFGTAYENVQLPSRYGTGEGLESNYVDHLISPFKSQRIAAVQPSPHIDAKGAA